MLSPEAKTLILEVEQIMEGKHPAYKGGPTYNAQHHLFQFGLNSTSALEIAENIQANIPEALEVTELHPDWIQWTVNRIKEAKAYKKS